MPASKDANPPPGGFLLLEVLIAFTIAALALSVLYHAVLTSLRSQQTSDRYEQALSHARSRLVIARNGAPLTQEDLHGDDGGGFTWRLLVTPIATKQMQPLGVAGLPRSPDSVVTLYALTVWIYWREAGRERSVRIDTEQIGQAAR